MTKPTLPPIPDRLQTVIEQKQELVENRKFERYRLLIQLIAEIKDAVIPVVLIVSALVLCWNDSALRPKAFDAFTYIAAAMLKPGSLGGRDRK